MFNQPAQPPTAPPPAADPALNPKPTGAFSQKKVWIAVAVTCAAIFAYLLFAPNPPRQQKAAVQQQAAQAQAVARTAATASQVTSDRDYSARLSDSMSKDAILAQENVRKYGAGAGGSAPLASTSSTTTTPLGSPLESDLQADSPPDSPRTRNTKSDPQADLRETIAADMQKRDAAALFAPLIVAFRRPPETPVTTAAPLVPPPSTDPAPPLPLTPPTVSPAHAPPFSAASPPPAPPATTSVTQDRSGRAAQAAAQNSLNKATGPAHKVFEGTTLEAVLTNRLNGTYSGPVNCMVTTDVWSHNRQHLLIPRGSRILGEARKVAAVGQSRLAVTFHRLIMPDGFSISLDTFVGMNQIGETGLKDKVDNHYKQIFGVSIALGAISGFNMRGTGSGANQSGADTWRQGFSQSLSQEATQILDRFLNILPTIIIRAGARVRVYLTDDLMLPAYQGHRMSSDL